MIKFIFGIQRNMIILYKLILSFWMCVTRDAQSTQNSLHIFPISQENHEV